MKRIDLVKYGFIRTPENDYSDDGSRFQTYKVGNKVLVSKLVHDGEAYLSGSIGGSDLPYEIYSKLPHYKAAEWEYNGVSVSTLTEDDLQKFYEACVAYEAEWNEAVANLVLPSAEDLEYVAMALTAHRQVDFDRAKLVISQNLEKLFKLSSYDYKQVQEDYLYLDRDIDRVPDWQALVGKPASLQVYENMKRDCGTHRFAYDRIMEKLG